MDRRQPLEPAPSARLRFWATWGAGFAIWAAAMVLASPWDLPVSRALVDRQAPLALLVARFGEWPGWLAVLAGLWLVLLRRRIRAAPTMLPLAWAMMLLALLQPLLITQLLKLLWGRVRLVHLDAGLASYTPFWIPAGVGAGASFPSGHVAMAMVPAPIPWWFLGQGRPVAAVAGGLAVVGLGAIVALGRIVAGKHYLTDTLFSLGCALLLAPLLLRWLRRRQLGRKSPV